jgi:hypothetical protein
METPMRRATNIGRFGILVVGYGVAAALAVTSPTAVADPAAPFNPLPLIPDPAAVPAEVPSTLNLAISVDGFSLFSSGSAQAESGTGGIAIAYGTDSIANAGGGGDTGLFDSAFADGANSTALAGTGDFDSSAASGAGSQAFSGLGNFDYAAASGTDSLAAVGGFKNDSSSFDYGSAVGTDSNAESGDFAGFTGQSDGNVATVFDPFGTEGSTAYAGDGLADLASVFGDNSDAYAGLSGSFDIAAVFGDSLGTANATGGNFLLDILPSL